MKKIYLFVFALCLCAFAADPLFAQVGALPYHYKITTRSGTGGAGNDYVLTFEIHDANHVPKGTDTCKYSSSASAHEIKDCISAKVKGQAATDAGGTSALITAMVGVDNDIDAAPAPSGSGISTLNTLTGSVQTFSVGTTGTDYNIISSGTAHTFHLPTASAANRGALASADWNTFNGKQAALGFTPANSTITISTTAPLTGGGDLSGNRTFAMAAATTSVDGYLTSTNWNTFNGKQAALGFTPENSANKGAANGYAGLNASSLVPVANLASGTPTGTKFIRDDGTLAVPSGGSDPWTYAILASDFITSSATAVDVTGLSFTPSANTRYEFEALLMVRTATTTVGPRPGLAWPTGMTDGIGRVEFETSATGAIWNFGNVNAALLVPVGGLPNTTQSWPARISGMLLAGASPSGTLQIRLASETAGTNVTMKAGSFIRYRTIP